MNNHFPILLAEDNPVSRKILENYLQKAGYEVVSVENGRKAMELLKKKHFPILLTDWMMPEMDGLELCKAIRRDITNDYVFIIILTVKDSKDDLVSGLEAGADDYLTKPINNAELIARIKTGIRILELEQSLKKANEEIEILSITDPLTEVYNRRYLTQNLPLEIKRARRYKHPLSMLICDIDYFKKVNDTYGHHVGDLVLKQVAKCIEKSIRNVDWMVRYGGEEFVIVVPETDIKGAYILAERLLNAISQKRIKIDENKISVTASFGITGFCAGTPEDKISFEAMVKQADEYLYKAKQEGRNRIEVGQL